MTARNYTNDAPPVALTVDVDDNDTVFTVGSTSGYPVAPFTLGIERGTVNEEACLVTALTGTTFTVTRGYDGTTAVPHTSPAAIEHCVVSLDYAEANAHINNTSLDHHTQYLNNARHDDPTRHVFGSSSALGLPAAPADIGTSASTGTGDGPPRWDHRHKLGAGSINDVALFGSNVVPRAALAATLLPIIQCVSGSRPSAPVEGQFAWQTNTDTLVFYSGSAWLDYAPIVPHAQWAKFVPTARTSVSAGAYTNWFPSAQGGPIQIAGFTKLRDETKIFVEIFGGGWPFASTGHRYTLGVNYGAATVELDRWASGSSETLDAAGGIRLHGGARMITGLAAGAYSFTAQIHVDTDGTTAWGTDSDSSWWIRVTEMM